MTSQQQVEVTIVGAGIVGICCALSLLEKGKSVRLIDKDAPGQGASYGNAGVVSPSSCVPQSLPGLWKTIPGWLLNPEGPISIRPAYLPKVLPWALMFLSAGRMDRVNAISKAMAALNRPSIDIYRRHLAGSCGFLALYQQELAVAVRMPVFAMEDYPEFREVILEGERNEMDTAKIENEILAAVKNWCARISRLARSCWNARICRLTPMRFRE